MAGDSRGEVTIHLRGGTILTLPRAEVDVEFDGDGGLAGIKIATDRGTDVLYLDHREVAAVVRVASGRPGFVGGG